MSNEAPPTTDMTKPRPKSVLVALSAISTIALVFLGSLVFVGYAQDDGATSSAVFADALAPLATVVLVPLAPLATLIAVLALAFCQKPRIVGILGFGVGVAGCVFAVNVVSFVFSFPSEGEQENYWPQRTDLEQTQAIRSACSLSSRKAGLLLSFSAPWCEGCRDLWNRQKDDDVQLELKKWSSVVVNIGQFDRHQDLIAAFDINSVPTWVVVRPKECQTPIVDWGVHRKSSIDLEKMDPVLWLRSALEDTDLGDGSSSKD